VGVGRVEVQKVWGKGGICKPVILCARSLRDVKAKQLLILWFSQPIRGMHPAPYTFAHPFMHVLKKSAVDLIVMLVVLGMVAMEANVLGLEGSVTVLWWALAVYTALLLVLKAGALVSARTLRQMNLQDGSVSPTVYRLLYAVNIIALFASGFWVLTAGWATIWGLSEAVRVRTGAPTGS